MTPERWTRVQALFEETLQQPPDGRAGWVAARADDDEMARLVGAMIEADESDLGEIEHAVGTAIRAATAAAAGPTVVRIGPYRIVSTIGQGGMGTVYVAERADGAFDQRVAIKIVRGLLDQERVRRFRAERQILASLQHPNIARLVDGGTTDDGWPDLVMEYVEGQGHAPGRLRPGASRGGYRLQQSGVAAARHDGVRQGGADVSRRARPVDQDLRSGSPRDRGDDEQPGVPARGQRGPGGGGADVPAGARDSQDRTRRGAPGGGAWHAQPGADSRDAGPAARGRGAADPRARDQTEGAGRLPRGSGRITRSARTGAGAAGAAGGSVAAFRRGGADAADAPARGSSDAGVGSVGAGATVDEGEPASGAVAAAIEAVTIRRARLDAGHPQIAEADTVLTRARAQR